VLSVGAAVLVITVMLAAPATATDPAGAKRRPKTAPLLFVVQGTGGSYTDNGNGTAALTLTGINGLTTWFTDRPQRHAGNTATPVALEMIGFADDPPNGVMTVSLADPQHDAIAVKLETPSYDEANATLTFTATPLEKTPGDGLRAYRSRLDDGVTSSFGEFSLFVDDTNTLISGDGTPKRPGGVDDFEIAVWVGTRDNTGESIDITPQWDGYNQCIKENSYNRYTNEPVAWVKKPPTQPLSIPSELPTHLTLSAERNTAGSCGVQQSRMHWLLTRHGHKGKEDIRALGGLLNPSSECVDIEAGLYAACGGRTSGILLE
jgi:hypothetical protein